MCFVGRSWESSETSRVETDPTAVIVEHARAQGLTVRRESVRWLAEDDDGDPLSKAPGPLERTRAVLIASRAGEPSDVYGAELSRSPLGQVLACSLVNISRTPAAFETGLVARDGSAAWLLGSNGTIVGARIAYFASVFGPNPPDAFEPSDWNALDRWQSRLQNLQDYGFLGLLAFDELEVPSEAQSAPPKVEWVRKVPGRPGSVVSWSAERLRETWLGERGVAVLKALGFAGLDYAELAIQAVLPSDGSERVAKNLGALLSRRTHLPSNALADFPPQALDPLFSPLEGEGRWLSLDEDPFVRRDAAGRSPFSFTFLRPDKARPYAQVYVVLWDPRRLELHMAAGTEEPRGPAGEHGAGLVAREPRVLGRLAGAFNGAFRTRHGEFGMGVGGEVYLPPRPYAATVATLDDGSTAFGTWPDSSHVPSSVVSFRQNMTPLLAGGVHNPYRRHYWGGLPDGWLDESFTVRTALCLTKERFVAYLYGISVDPSSLMRAAEAVRCDYALHLDMNAGNTGFEFYRTAPAGGLGELARPLDEDWEARGTVRSSEGHDFDFVARRMTEGMPLMSFPRYIRREPRDFFYLTLRARVDELPLPAGWKATGPENGWEIERDEPLPRMAHASVAPTPALPDARVHLLALDPRGLSVALERPSDERADDVLLRVEERLTSSLTATSLWWHEGAFSIAVGAPRPSATRIGVLSEAGAEQGATAFVGLHEHGFLVYGELAAGVALPSNVLLEMCRALQLRTPRLLSEGLGFQGPRAPGPARAERSVTLRRASGPHGRLLFPGTPVVPPQVWAFRQRAPVSRAPTLDTSASVHPR